MINEFLILKNMKAIKVTVDYGEWSKVSDFLRELDGEDLFSYQIDNVSFVIVANVENLKSIDPLLYSKLTHQ
ncbi:hypothetical protein, partial [Bacteroides acidifaciens]|uniref:hypothetical protein n=1 Tax=Bacteroides acidifaciens TaxID=85831 RepID=UPI0030138D8D